MTVPRDDAGEERPQRLGDMVDVIRLGAFACPVDGAAQPHRGHAERSGRREVLRHVLDHRGAARRDGEAADQRFIAGGVGFRHVAAIGDIEDAGEMPGDPEMAEDVLGVADRAVGEDEFPPRQRAEGGVERRVLRDDREIDAVDVVEEGRRVDAVHVHQPAQCRAVLAEPGLLQPLRLVEIDPQQLGDELAHAAMDLIEEVARGRVERVVEIEDPALDGSEIRDPVGPCRGVGFPAHRGLAAGACL